MFFTSSHTYNVYDIDYFCKLSYSILEFYVTFGHINMNFAEERGTNDVGST